MPIPPVPTAHAGDPELQRIHAKWVIAEREVDINTQHLKDAIAAKDADEEKKYQAALDQAEAVWNSLRDEYDQALAKAAAFTSSTGGAGQPQPTPPQSQKKTGSGQPEPFWEGIPDDDLKQVLQALGSVVDAVNGERYYQTGSGARWIEQGQQKVIFISNTGPWVATPLPQEPDLATKTFYDCTDAFFAQGGVPKKTLIHFLMANCIFVLTDEETQSWLQNEVKGLSQETKDQQCALACGLRSHVAMAGVIGPHHGNAWDPTKYHVNYNDCVLYNAAQTEELMGRVFPTNRAPNADETSLQKRLKAMMAYLLSQDPALKLIRFKEMMRGTHDCIAVVNFMFRTRAHHYNDSMEKTYARLMNACILPTKITASLPNHQFMAVMALHCIFPIVMDQFMLRCRERGEVCGAMQLRWDPLPAGAIALEVVAKGWADVDMIFQFQNPELRDCVDYVMKTYHTLKKCAQDSSSSVRYTGSVNRHFYGAPDFPWDQAKVTLCASIVKAVYEKMGGVEAANLLGSESLKKLAAQAPVTGGALGDIAERVLRMESFVETWISAHRKPPTK